jgi:hypothetical protein
MDRAHKMGTRADMQARSKNVRRDNVQRQKLIQRARAIIYDQHKAVDNSEVESLLQPNSYVPTEVCRTFFCCSFRF